jgi:hypothetical protein
MQLMGDVGMFLRFRWQLGIVVCSVMLTACGGGGGDSSTPVGSDGVVVTPPPAVDSPDAVYPDGSSAALTVIVRLWYQSVSPAYVSAMSHRGAKSDRLRIMVREQPPLPELLATDSVVVEF